MKINSSEHVGKYDFFKNKEMLGCLIGTLLGDGWLTKASKTSYRGGISHCEKQLQYLEYKQEIFFEISNKIYKKDIKEITIKGKEVKDKVSYFFRFKIISTFQKTT